MMGHYSGLNATPGIGLTVMTLYHCSGEEYPQEAYSIFLSPSKPSGTYADQEQKEGMIWNIPQMDLGVFSLFPNPCGLCITSHFSEILRSSLC